MSSQCGPHSAVFTRKHTNTHTMMISHSITVMFQQLHTTRGRNKDDQVASTVVFLSRMFPRMHKTSPNFSPVCRSTLPELRVEYVEALLSQRDPNLSDESNNK